ncbi:MAG: diaminopimelate epimerase [Pseudomonadota bacterium]
MIPFRKMNGLGNDFVVVDARRQRLDFKQNEIRALANRETGIGFDQFIIIAPPEHNGDALMRIFNADGGEVEACGNAARCVAAVLLDESGRGETTIESAGGLMTARPAGPGRTAIDMGLPRFDGASIPLSADAGNPQRLMIEGFADRYGPAACVNVGNPHAVFFVADVGSIPLREDGPILETHPLFPERANITFAEALDREHVVARVWERGVGPTRACGTAACAVAALSAKLGLTGTAVEVMLPGGPLLIDVTSGRILMEGPYALDYEGTLPEPERAR